MCSTIFIVFLEDFEFGSKAFDDLILFFFNRKNRYLFDFENIRK